MSDEPKKKKWRFGKEMPPFSGKSYGELNDIYPINSRIKDDAWRMVGLMLPAWIVTQRQYEEQLGCRMRFSSFQELCWMQRCEERAEGFAFLAYPAMKGMNISGAIFAARKARLTQLGLVENMPTTSKARIYRVTGLGKMIIKSFTENLNSANDNLEYWLSKINPEDFKRTTYYLVTLYPEWKGKGFQPHKVEEVKQESSLPSQEL